MMTTTRSEEAASNPRAARRREREDGMDTVVKEACAVHGLVAVVTHAGGQNPLSVPGNGGRARDVGGARDSRGDASHS
jgi:hypothetical protein